MTHTSLVFYSSRLVRLPHAMGAKVKLHGIKRVAVISPLLGILVTYIITYIMGIVIPVNIDC